MVFIGHANIFQNIGIIVFPMKQFILILCATRGTPPALPPTWRAGAENREHCREQVAESREQTAQSKNSKLTADLKTKNAAKMEVRRFKNEAEGRFLGTLGKGITLVWAARGTPRRRTERRSATGLKGLN